MTDQRLRGQVALITGAASGNGRAIALRYAAEGASVVCADITQEAVVGSWEESTPTHELIAEQGGNAIYAQCDVSDGDQVIAAIAATKAEFGGLDLGHLAQGVLAAG